MTRDTLLFRRDEARRASRLALQARVVTELRAALATLVPGSRVWVFGSLVQPGQKLAQIYDLAQVEVRLPIPSTDAAFVDLPVVQDFDQAQLHYVHPSAGAGLTGFRLNDETIA